MLPKALATDSQAMAGTGTVRNAVSADGDFTQEGNSRSAEGSIHLLCDPRHDREKPKSGKKNIIFAQVGVAYMVGTSTNLSVLLGQYWQRILFSKGSHL